MAGLKNVIIDDDTYSGVKFVSIRDADVAATRDLFLSEDFIEDNTKVAKITRNGVRTLMPRDGFEATRQVVVNVEVPSVIERTNNDVY